MPKPEIQEKFDTAMASQTLSGRAMRAALRANTVTAALMTPRWFDDRSPAVETINSTVVNKQSGLRIA
jgi:hypothetical protein